VRVRVKERGADVPVVGRQVCVIIVCILAFAPCLCALENGDGKNNKGKKTNRKDGTCDDCNHFLIWNPVRPLWTLVYVLCWQAGMEGGRSVYVPEIREKHKLAKDSQVSFRPLLMLDRGQCSQVGIKGGGSSVWKTGKMET